MTRRKLFGAVAAIGVVVVVAAVPVRGDGTWTNVRPDLWRGDLYDVFFVDSLKGWVVGTHGRIGMTTDGGATWDLHPPVPSGTYHAIDFVDSLRGWVVGSGGLILHTTDGGVSWVEQESGVDLPLTGIDMVDSLYGWVSGYRTPTPDHAVVLRTRDGGTIWRESSPALELWPNAVAFADRERGWVVGRSEPNVIRTTNSGVTWEAESLGTSADLKDICVTDPYHGWIVGPVDTIFRKAGIEGWEAVPVDVGHGLEGIHFWHPREGWAVGRAHVLHSTDGGLTWEKHLTGVGNHLNAVHSPDGEHVWSVGEYSAIVGSRDGGETWELQSDPSNPLGGITFVDSLRGWAVGSRGAILHSDDGGLSWRWQRTSTDVWFPDVSFVDSVHGWAVGSGGVVARTRDGGESWEVDTTDIGHPLDSVSFVDTLEGWVLPCPWGSGSVYHTAEGGGEWTHQLVMGGSAVVMVELNNVVFIDAQRGWIVGWYHIMTLGDHGVIWHTQTGGESWTTQFNEENVFFEGVDFVDSLHGWSVGGGQAYYTRDRGEQWHLMLNSVDGWFMSVAGADRAYAWGIVSLPPNPWAPPTGIVRTTDGGVTWEAQTNPAPDEWLYGLCSHDRNHVWACGDDGVILKYIDNVSVDDDQSVTAPACPSLTLFACRPNPSGGPTVIAYALPRGMRVHLDIYNILGQRVRTLEDGEGGPGRCALIWDGTDHAGHRVSSGVYFVRMQAGGESACRKIVMIR